MEKTFNEQKAIEAQKEYTRFNEMPHFAPNDGKCWNCNKNIYSNLGTDEIPVGISVEKAGNTLVTGCPHCHRSYCD